MKIQIRNRQNGSFRVTSFIGSGRRSHLRITRFNRKNYELRALIHTVQTQLTLLLLTFLATSYLLAENGWIITDTQVWEDQTITLTGDLVVRDGGHLTLKGVTLRVGEQYGIRVEEGGSLFIYANSHITATDLSSPFRGFTAYGTAFEMIDSRLSGCPTLDLKTDGAIIQGNMFPYNPNLIYVRSSNVTIKGNSVELTYGGITLYEAENCNIKDNNIYSERDGFPIFLLNSHNNEVTGNDIESQVGTLVLAGSNQNLIANNTIIGHHNHGVVLMYSSDDNLIKENTISAEESGISIWGWNNRVEDNVINGDVIETHMGIYMVNAYNSIVTRNNISDAFVEGIFVRHSSNNLIADNVVTARQDIPGYAGPAYGLLLWGHSQKNVLRSNTITGFDRGIALHANSNSNSISANRVENTTLEGIILENSSNNLIFDDNVLSSVGRPACDSGGNTWNYQGSLSGPEVAAKPQFNNPTQKVITGQEIIADTTIHLAHFSVEDGASLVLKNATVIGGAKRKLDENQRSVMHDVGIDVASGGSLTIDNCKMVHHEYGNGFQVALQKGSSFTMKNSEVHGAGSEWGYGGIRIETHDPIVEGNLLTETILNCFDCGSGSRIANNRILNSYFAINLNHANDLIIRDNIIKGSIRPAIIGPAAKLWIEGNLISDIWEDGIQLWGGDNHLLAGNTFQNIREPGNCIGMFGDGHRFIRNRMINSHHGMVLSGGETAVGNIFENCEVGLFINEPVEEFEGNIIKDCGVGIELTGANSTLSKNTISECETGIRISGGMDNILFQNNFTRNTVQATDLRGIQWHHDGVGNFWSDYPGNDSDNNGVGDTAYLILPNGSDPYPLMTPHQDWTTSALTTEKIVYPQLALGGNPKSYECILVVSNKTNFDWEGTLSTYRRNHQDWKVNWEIGTQDYENESSLSLALHPKASTKIKLTGTEDVLTGYLEIDANANSSVFDVALSFFYNYIDPVSGQVLDSVGVPPGSIGDEFMLPVENSSGVNTGLAWTTSSEEDSFEISFALIDSTGQEIASEVLNYDGQLARFFTEIFNQVPKPFLGRLHIKSEKSIYAVGIRFEESVGNFQLTGVPVDGFIF